MNGQAPHPIVRAALYVYVFSLPLEVPSRSIPLEVHTITGSILLASALLQPQVCFRPPPAAFWWFAAYLQIYVALGVVTQHEGEWLKAIATFMQVLLLFWVCGNLMRHVRVATTALLAFVLSCTVLAVLQRLGLTTTVAEVTSVAERVTALGQNPNTFAHNVSLGLLAFVGLCYGSNGRSGYLRPFVWIVSGLLALTIMPTAARGAALALVAGILMIVLMRGALSVKLRNAVVVGALLAGLGLAGYRSDAMRNRLLATSESNDFAQRENLFPAAWQMFLEKPLVGWGPVNNRYEIERHVPRAELPFRETHNMVLELLTETGLLGAIPYLIGVWLCARASWRAQSGAHGVLPLAMMVFVLISKMTTSGIYTKTHWFVLAFAVASGSRARFGRVVMPSSLAGTRSWRRVSNQLGTVDTVRI
jgi:O-antigen ligase